MRHKVIPDYLAVLHHKSNALQLANVGDRISSNADEIGKFPGSTAPTLSCQPNNSAALVVIARMIIERRHTSVMQRGKHVGGGLAARFSRIEPAHV
jgi:hypothetical protein